MVDLEGTTLGDSSVGIVRTSIDWPDISIVVASLPKEHLPTPREAVDRTEDKPARISRDLRCNPRIPLVPSVLKASRDVGGNSY
jgi:hypothetical protein